MSITKQTVKLSSVDIGERETSEPGKLEALTNSVRKGLQQPILVASVEGTLHLLDGMRRIEAVRALGLNEIEALIVDTFDEALVKIPTFDNVPGPLGTPYTVKLDAVWQIWVVMRVLGDQRLTQRRSAWRSGRNRPLIKSQLIATNSQVKLGSYRDEFVDHTQLSENWLVCLQRLHNLRDNLPAGSPQGQLLRDHILGPALRGEITPTRAVWLAKQAKISSASASAESQTDAYEKAIQGFTGIMRSLATLGPPTGNLSQEKKNQWAAELRVIRAQFTALIRNLERTYS